MQKFWRKPIGIASPLHSRPRSGVGVMEVVICRELPQHRLPLSEDVISEEKVVRFLALPVKKGVVVVAFHALYHVPGLARPLIDLPVRLHGVH